MNRIALAALISLLLLASCGDPSAVNESRRCRNLPTREAAERIVREHRDVITELEKLGPGNSVFAELSEPCPGRATLLIYYPSVDVRKRIEAMIGETFYGVPYRLVNI